MRANDPNSGGRRRSPTFLRGAAPLLFAALLLAVLPAFGQPPYPARGLAGFTVGGLFPAGSFNSRVGRDGFALGLSLALRSGFSSALVGFELSASYYGHTHRHAPMEGVPEIVFDVDTYNNIVQGLFFLRFQPKRLWNVTPYLELLAGVSYFFTDTSVSDADGEQAYDVNFDDWALTAGVGGGFAVPLGRKRKMGLDFKFRYLAGGRATYLTQGGVIVDGDRVVYVTDRSATGFFTVQTGLTWFF